MTGPVHEDWAAWAKLFTDDATYFDHFYGTFTGPDEITKFLEGTMGAAPQVYSPLVWYVVDGTRVAYKVVNRADNPEPGGAPIDFPSYQFIEYAGDGKWRSEEDVWVFAEMKVFARCYAKAVVEHPQTLEQQTAPRGLGLVGRLGASRTRTSGRPIMAGQGRFRAVHRHCGYRLRHSLALTPPDKRGSANLPVALRV